MALSLALELLQEPVGGSSVGLAGQAFQSLFKQGYRQACQHL